MSDGSQPTSTRLAHTAFGHSVDLAALVLVELERHDDSELGQQRHDDGGDDAR